MAGALGLATQADATLVATSAQGGSALGGVNYLNFDGLTSGFQGTASYGSGASGVDVSFTPDAQAVQNSLVDQYAAPYLSLDNNLHFGGLYAGADTTTYLTSGSDGNVNGASITFSFNHGQNYFGLLWGSVDDYNTLTFYNGATPLGSLSGSDIGYTGPNGSQGNQAANGTVYVNIVSSVDFTKVVATSSQYAFEFDNVAYGVVPEPTTILAGALMLLPFGASAVRILRRQAA